MIIKLIHSNRTFLYGCLIVFFGATACVSVPKMKKWDDGTFVREANNPVIYQGMKGLEGHVGENINGPSVIKVPKWIENPLGKFYMYFAHHHGKYIRMAYSDTPEGPWTIYEPGVLHLSNTAALSHIASPDVLIDEENKTIRMYFHGQTPNKGGQKTFLSTSKDGLGFKASDTILGPFYFRVFNYKGYYYALASGTFYRSRDGILPFEKGASILPRVRHTALTVAGDNLVVLYSRKNDAPERILKSVVDLSDGTWKSWTASPPEEVLRPEKPYEGAGLPIKKSVNGFAKEKVHELRDPGLLIDNNDVYLYYSVAGESGIAVAKLVKANR